MNLIKEYFESWETVLTLSGFFHFIQWIGIFTILNLILSAIVPGVQCVWEYLGVCY